MGAARTTRKPTQSAAFQRRFIPCDLRGKSQYSAAPPSLGYDFAGTGRGRDMADDILIVKTGAGHIRRLEPLWRALHSRHLEIDPGLAAIPIRSQEDAWDRRRRLYAAWLAEEDAFLLTAEQRGR